jgi:hypothetical protein
VARAALNNADNGNTVGPSEVNGKVWAELWTKQDVRVDREKGLRLI